MEEKLVSIIVPVYNVQNYLDRCMESLVYQTYGNISIVLVDDGSSDDSSVKCDLWQEKDNRIIVVHKQNEGLGMARNTGMEYSCGDFIMFVDSDDYIEKNAIEVLVKQAEDNAADIVATKFIYDYGVEKSEIKSGLYSGTDSVKVLLTHMMGSLRGKKDQFNLSSCTKLYSRQLIEKNGIRFPSERKLIWEDFAFNCKVFNKATRVLVLDYPYYHYCYNGDSLTHKYDPRKYQKVMDMYEYICKELMYIDMPTEAFDRVNNMFIGNVRTCMKLEALYSKQNGVIAAVKNIRKMCVDERLQTLVKSISREELNKQQYIYNLFIKLRCPEILYILATFQNKRKGNLVN